MKVASYNIHGCVGTDGKFDVGRIIAVLDELTADILLLQEVGDHLERHPTLDQARAIADACAMDFVTGPTMPKGPWGYGNAVVTRGRLIAAHRFDLSVPGREPRGCLRVEIAIGKSTVTVTNLHLGLTWGERKRQIDQLLDQNGPVHGISSPLIVGGDFNDWPPGPTTRLLGRSYLDAAWPSLDFRATYPTWLPLLRLDRIYSNHALKWLGYRVHRSVNARHASDHLPIVATYAVS